MAKDKDVVALLKVILAVMFLPIFLIWLMWKKTSWPNWTKWLVTGVVAIFYISVIGGSNSVVPAQNTVTVPIKQVEVQSQIGNGPQAQVQSKVESQSQPVSAVEKQAQPTQKTETKTSQTYKSSTNCGEDYYQNSDGICVHSPSNNPSGATAQCRDGSYSYSLHRSGTCSGHGGVSEWF